MLSGGIHTKGHIIYYYIYMKYPERANPYRQKVHQWLPGTKGRREWGATASGYGVSFWGAENVLEIDKGDCCTTLNILIPIELYILNG